MDKDYSELIHFLDQKFSGADDRFGQVDNELKDIRGDIKELKENFNNLLGAIDAYAKKADAYFQEMVMLSHKVDRHERWIQQIAEKMGVKLDY